MVLEEVMEKYENNYGKINFGLALIIIGLAFIFKVYEGSGTGIGLLITGILITVGTTLYYLKDQHGLFSSNNNSYSSYNSYSSPSLNGRTSQQLKDDSNKMKAHNRLMAERKLKSKKTIYSN